METGTGNGKQKMGNGLSMVATDDTDFSLSVLPFSYLVLSKIVLFRHCVRSTPATFKLYSKTVTAENKYDANDFTASPLPNWNVPTKLCTERDVDTSFALYQGIRDFLLAGNKTQRIISSLSDLNYDPSLFDPSVV